MREDNNIFQEALKADPQTALSWLYSTFSSRVYRAAFLYLHSTVDAEDICHEVFTTAMENAYAYRGEAGPYTWLYSILRNKVGKLLAQRKTARQHQQAVARKLSETRLLDNTPEDLACETETRTAVQQAVSMLPDDMQALVHMRYFEEFTGDQMASVLGITHARVRSRLSEARALLRSIMISKEIQP